MSRLVTVLTAVSVLGAGGLGASSAQARTGQAPVRDPAVTSAHHIDFNLLGTGWGQGRGESEATPSPGNYGRSLHGDANCAQRVAVSGYSTAGRPVVRGNRVTLRPQSVNNDPILFVHSERHHGVTSWSGTQANSDAAFGGVQLLPPALRQGTRRWLVYVGRVAHDGGDTVTPACAQGVRKTAAPVSRSAARSLRLASHAVQITPPYFGL